MRNAKIILVLLCCLAGQLQGWAQDTKSLTLLQTSDVHSRILPVNAGASDAYAGMGGFVRRATLVNELRWEDPELLLLDCGDFSQGTPYYNLFQGELEVKLMNEMGYDVATIGNHEFDYGMENMARLFRLARFTVVCANYGVAGTQLEGLVKPYTIIERNGLRIGIFGVSPKIEGLVQADKCVGVTFKDPVTAANEVAAKLKLEENCDAVICLSHLGIDYDRTKLVPQTRHIDVVLGGHSHTFMKEPEMVLNLDQKPVPLSHTGARGVLVGRTNLIFNRK